MGTRDFRGDAVCDILNEDVEKELGVAGSRCRLWMELHGEERLVLAIYPSLLPSLAFWKSSFQPDG
jgi:hypothetical protein